MSGCDSNIAIGQDQILYAKIETTCGTFEAPSGSDAIRVINDASFMQGKDFLNDEQKRLTLSRLSRIPGGFSAGTFSFTSYIKPSGVLGTAPKLADVLEAGFGKETIAAGASVTYTLAGINDAVKSLSIVYKRGHATFFNVGCFVNKLTFPFQAGNDQASIGQVTVEGVFFKQVRAGTTAVNNGPGYVAADTSIVVDDAKEIDKGALIKFGTEDNAGAGYTVSSSTIATNTIVISPGLANAISDDDTVDGFVPTATDAGTPVHGRFGAYQEDPSGGYADVVIKSGSIEITNNIKVIEDEKTDTSYPETVIRATKREVNVNVDKIFKTGDVSRWYESIEQTQVGVKIPMGDTAAERYRLEAPKVEWDIPELSGDEEVVRANSGIAVASSSFDDELQLVFD